MENSKDCEIIGIVALGSLGDCLPLVALAHTIENFPGGYTAEARGSRTTRQTTQVKCFVVVNRDVLADVRAAVPSFCKVELKAVDIPIFFDERPDEDCGTFKMDEAGLKLRRRRRRREAELDALLAACRGAARLGACPFAAPAAAHVAAALGAHFAVLAPAPAPALAAAAAVSVGEGGAVPGGAMAAATATAMGGIWVQAAARRLACARPGIDLSTHDLAHWLAPALSPVYTPWRLQHGLRPNYLVPQPQDEGSKGTEKALPKAVPVVYGIDPILYRPQDLPSNMKVTGCWRFLYQNNPLPVHVERFFSKFNRERIVCVDFGSMPYLMQSLQWDNLFMALTSVLDELGCHGLFLKNGPLVSQQLTCQIKNNIFDHDEQKDGLPQTWGENPVNYYETECASCSWEKGNHIVVSDFGPTTWFWNHHQHDTFNQNTGGTEALKTWAGEQRQAHAQEMSATANTITSSSFIPHGFVLPRCSIFVHHGGAGTCAAALEAQRSQSVSAHHNVIPQANAIKSKLPEGNGSMDTTSKKRNNPTVASLSYPATTHHTGATAAPPSEGPTGSPPTLPGRGGLPTKRPRPNGGGGGSAEEGSGRVGRPPPRPQRQPGPPRPRQLVVPLAHDQPAWARRLAARGAGLALGAAGRERALLRRVLGAAAGGGGGEEGLPLSGGTQNSGATLRGHTCRKHGNAAASCIAEKRSVHLFCKIMKGKLKILLDDAEICTNITDDEDSRVVVLNPLPSQYKESVTLNEDIVTGDSPRPTNMMGTNSSGEAAIHAHVVTHPPKLEEEVISIQKSSLALQVSSGTLSAAEFLRSFNWGSK